MYLLVSHSANSVGFALELESDRLLNAFAATFSSTMNFEIYFGAFCLDFIWIRMQGPIAATTLQYNFRHVVNRVGFLPSILLLLILIPMVKALNFPFLAKSPKSSSGCQAIKWQSLRYFTIPLGGRKPRAALPALYR